MKGNIGDFAILHAMLSDIATRHPGCRIRVVPQRYLSLDARRIKAFQESGVPDFDLTLLREYKQRPRIYRLLLKHCGDRVARTVYTWIMRFRALRLISEAARSDRIYLSGGDQWNGFIGIDMLATLSVVRKVNRMIYSFPFSINPKTVEFMSARLLKTILGGIVAPCPVRDTISLQVIRSIGLEAKLTPDCVFSLYPLSATIEPQSNRDPSRILVVLTGTGSVLLSSLEALVARFEGTNICLMSTCDHEDGPVYRQIASKSGIEYLAPITWQETVAELKASRLVVTNRLHCIILSTFAEVPVVPVTDRKKSEAFVVDANLPCFSGTCDDVTIPLVETAYENRHEIIERMIAYRNGSLAGWLERDRPAEPSTGV